MNRRLLQAIALFVCFIIFTACGNNGSSNSTSSTANSIATETSENKHEQEKKTTDSETKTDPTEKYKNIKDVLLALENEEYDKAIELINAMKSEPETEVVKINMENWTEYFSIESKATNDYDAMKNIKSVSESWCLVLKPEYEERNISLSGEVGIEAEYEDEIHKITNIDKTTGSYESESFDRDSFVNESSSITGYDTGYLLYDLDISKTYGLKTTVGITDSEFIAVKSHDEELGKLLLKDADEWIQYARYPKIKIVRIEGELILSK